MDILSRRIRELRVDSDMKQGDMGAALGITQNMVSNYENGREPPLETVLAYAAYFNVSVEYLLGVSNERVRAPQDGAQMLDDMQAAAVAHGCSAFTRSDIAQLAGAFVAYFKAGAPAGNAPMECVTAFLPAMGRVLDAAAHQDVAAMLVACDDVAQAGLKITGALGHVLGVAQEGENQKTT